MGHAFIHFGSKMLLRSTKYYKVLVRTTALLQLYTTPYYICTTLYYNRTPCYKNHAPHYNCTTALEAKCSWNNGHILWPVKKNVTSNDIVGIIRDTQREIIKNTSSSIVIQPCVCHALNRNCMWGSAEAPVDISSHLNVPWNTTGIAPMWKTLVTCYKWTTVNLISHVVANRTCPRIRKWESRIIRTTSANSASMNLIKPRTVQKTICAVFSWTAPTSHMLWMSMNWV